MQIPLFKSHFSIGKSILTLDDPSNDTYPNGPKSIYSILKEENLKELVLLEDRFFSFYNAYRYCNDNDIKLSYGVNFKYSETDSKSEYCKIAIFIKNKDGYQDLIKVNTSQEKNGFLSKDSLNNLFTNNLLLAIPFYDSFIFKNCMSFSSYSDFLLKFKPCFFIEDNKLPFDSMIRESVLALALNKFDVYNAKTICYYKKSDIDAFLTYKCICDRGFGKQKTLSRPNFDHFCSDEFCFESFKENNDTR